MKTTPSLPLSAFGYLSGVGACPQGGGLTTGPSAQGFHEARFGRDGSVWRGGSQSSAF